MARKKRSSRLERDSGETHTDREMSDRSVTEDRELSDSERLDMFRQSMFQSALPDIPPIPGYHVCWLTTTNPRDPIHARMRLGYTPIRSSDIPGWEHSSLKSGEWEGCIGINEMVAFKLPLNLYQAYMTEAHHTQPLAEEEKLTIAARVAQESANQVAKSRRAPLEMEEGLQELSTGDEPSPPDFTRVVPPRVFPSGG